MSVTLRNTTARPQRVPFAQFPVLDDDGNQTPFTLSRIELQPGASVDMSTTPPVWIADQLEAQGFVIEENT